MPTDLRRATGSGCPAPMLQRPVGSLRHQAIAPAFRLLQYQSIHAAQHLSYFALQRVHRRPSRMASRRLHRSRRRRCSPCQGNPGLEVARFKVRHAAKPRSDRPLQQDGTEADHHLCSGIRSAMKAICRWRQTGAPQELRTGGCSGRIESFNACALPPIYYMRTTPVDRPQISKRRRLDDIPARPPRIKKETMSISASKKAELISEFAISKRDVGSPEVQVAVLTTRISNLTEHFKTHKKDDHSRRGLRRLIAQRRKLLDYVKSKDEKRYRDLIGRLGIRR